MTMRTLFQGAFRKLLHRHGDVKSFEQEMQSSGGMTGRVDGGTHTIDTRKIIGSVGRAQTLRSDFFYKHGKAMTARFHRVGAAMAEGKVLPPLELYKVKRAATEKAPPPPSEYYVVDGHHRVAMARKMGQDFLDAHVVEYRVGTPPTSAEETPASPPNTSVPASGDTARDASPAQDETP